jgi:hypothetical protein
MKVLNLADNKARRRFPAALVAILMVTGLGFSGGGIQAAPGDLLATVTLPGNGTCNVAGTLATTGFGTHYMVINSSGCSGTTIGVYTPCAGAVCAATAVATKTFPVTLSGLAYDPFRSTAANVVLWGAHNGDVYRMDLGDPTVTAAATQTFICTSGIGGSSLDDGLAYDQSDDTLYVSPDVNQSVYQLSLGTGGNGPACTVMNIISPEDAGGAADGSVSGVAIGANNTLYIARNGEQEIRQIDKTTGAYILGFPTFSDRVEALTCDPVTYAPLEAVLGKDAFGELYEAFEVEPDTCPLVGVLDADIDIKFCSNPNGFNCKSGGVMPMTVFGSGSLDVTEIDLDTVMLCLADDEGTCIFEDSLEDANVEDRGNPDDVGAAECAINDETGEQERFLNKDLIMDLELAWNKRDVVDVLFASCRDFGKKEASPTLVFIALTFDGLEVRSTPVDSPGVDQVWRQK